MPPLTQDCRSQCRCNPNLHPHFTAASQEPPPTHYHHHYHLLDPFNQLPLYLPLLTTPSILPFASFPSLHPFFYTRLEFLYCFPKHPHSGISPAALFSLEPPDSVQFRQPQPRNLIPLYQLFLHLCTLPLPRLCQPAYAVCAQKLSFVLHHLLVGLDGLTQILQDFTSLLLPWPCQLLFRSFNIPLRDRY